MEIDILCTSSHVSDVTHETATKSKHQVNDFEHICDLSKGISLKRKNNCAVKHINKALRTMNSVYTNIEDIPYEGYTDILAGKIGTYMAKYATSYMKEGGKLVSCLTAISYMSSFKTFFLDKFRYVCFKIIVVLCH